jgi:hypothetical protein
MSGRRQQDHPVNALPAHRRHRKRNLLVTVQARVESQGLDPRIRGQGPEPAVHGNPHGTGGLAENVSHRWRVQAGDNAQRDSFRLVWGKTGEHLDRRCDRHAVEDLVFDRLPVGQAVEALGHRTGAAPGAGPRSVDRAVAPDGEQPVPEVLFIAIEPVQVTDDLQPRLTRHVVWVVTTQDVEVAKQARL